MRSFFWLPVVLMLGAAPAHAGHSAPKILMRIYVQTTGNGQPDMQSRQIAIPPNNETILIRSLPEVTEEDLTHVQTDASGYTHFLFGHQGQVNLDAVTGQDQGRILVVTINGVIVYAPIIDEQITTGELVIPHPLPPQVVSLLQETAKRNIRHNQSL